MATCGQREQLLSYAEGALTIESESLFMLIREEVDFAFIFRRGQYLREFFCQIELHRSGDADLASRERRSTYGALRSEPNRLSERRASFDPRSLSQVPSSNYEWNKHEGAAAQGVAYVPRHSRVPLRLIRTGEVPHH